MTLKNYTFLQLCQMLIVPAFFATLKMLVISGIMSTIFGFIFGVILVITEKGGLCENVVVNRILDFLVNTIRSFPFIILLISIIPFTRLIVGTSIGETAALVPLTVACSPFMARIFQNSFKEVDPALIEAAQSFGASKVQIIVKVMLKEFCSVHNFRTLSRNHKLAWLYSYGWCSRSRWTWSNSSYIWLSELQSGDYVFNLCDSDNSGSNYSVFWRLDLQETEVSV